MKTATFVTKVAWNWIQKNAPIVERKYAIEEYVDQKHAFLLVLRRKNNIIKFFLTYIRELLSNKSKTIPEDRR